MQEVVDGLLRDKTRKPGKPPLPVTCSPEMAPFFGRVCSNEGRTNEAQQVQR
jgi:hypothetical protein